MQHQFVPIISTKLKPPRLGRPEIIRPRLLSELERHWQQSLTLVMGAAGYGKTTLMVQWYEQLLKAGVSTAWLTLDGDDNIPDQFLSYFCSVCKQLEPSMSVQIEEYGELGSTRVPHYIVAEIVNTLAEQQKEYALFIDDYHLISDDQVHEILQYFLFNMPTNVNVYVGSRHVPPFSMPRLKVAGQVHLLGSKSLRFTQQEAEQFILDRTGYALEPQEMEVLLDRTEGWPAALQLASPSLSQLDERKRFLQNFSGSHGSVTDFLAEEVLKRLPPRVLALLLKIAVVDRFNIPLCAALTGESDVRAIVKSLQDDSLMLQSFGDEDHWYRFHPLVRSFLFARLEAQHDQEVKGLHAKAAIWFEQQGLVSEAVDQLLKADQHDYALSLLERYALDMLEQGQLSLFIGLVRKLPQSQIASCESILVPLAWAQLLSHNSDELPLLLDQIESSLEHAEGDQRREIELDISVIKAALLLFKDEFELCQMETDRWPQIVESNRLFTQVTLNNVRECVDLVMFRFEQIYRMQQQSEALFARLENPGTKFYCGLFATLGLLEQARLDEAKSLSDETLDLCSVAQNREVVYRDQSVLLKGIGEYYSGRTDRAMRLFEPNIGVLKSYAISDFAIKALAPIAGAYWQHLGAAKAQAFLVQFASVARHRELIRLQACVLHEQVRLLLRDNDTEAANRLFLQAAGLTSLSDAETSVAGAQAWEWYRLTKARLLIHAQDVEAAEAVLYPLQQRFQNQGRYLRLLEVILLLARLAWERNHNERARMLLAEALSLPADASLIQPFVDEGKGMISIYQSLSVESKSSLEHTLCESIIARLEEATVLTVETSPVMAEGESTAFQPLIEPLSARELEVLTLLAEGCSNREIAEQLFLSVDTIKTHLKSIYSKMDVARRTQAVSLGRQLKLIE